MHRSIEDQDEEEDEEEYTVTPRELNLCRMVFDENCGSGRRMDIQQFSNFYQQDYSTTKNAFGLMDRDQDGFISFDDFLLGYCKTRSQSHTKYNHRTPFGNRIDQNLPFGPLDEYDPYSVPIEKIAQSLKPYVY